MERTFSAYISPPCADEHLFIDQTELLDTFDDKSAEDVGATPHTREQDIGFGRSDFSWSIEPATAEASTSQQSFRLHIEDDVVFRRGSFNLIIGPTGSGKTSILMALLGEMHQIPLGPDPWINLPRKSGVAYAAQESWVLSDTIKVSYSRVDIRASCLRPRRRIFSLALRMTRKGTRKVGLIDRRLTRQRSTICLQ